jgi:hypothetical protein
LIWPRLEAADVEKSISNQTLKGVTAMKKVIGGKLYNCATATKVASASNGLRESDHKHCYESIYRTKKGNWFIYGEGGGLTKYRKAVGDAFTSGDGLQPLTADEAMAWLEQHDEIEVLEEYFSDRIHEA